ncbi:MAG TPA: hypothetical protein VKD91_17235, partial [Pyrinomonadaceae bacterium]|nr:hypothetical protein [Pyrinomonadaceae bacterium]
MLKRRTSIFFVVWLLALGSASGQYPTPLTSEPTVFAPDVISTADYEVCPEFSPDGSTFYF